MPPYNSIGRGFPSGIGPTHPYGVALVISLPSCDAIGRRGSRCGVGIDLERGFDGGVTVGGERSPGRAAWDVSLDELGLISNVLNLICNDGRVEAWEFERR